MNYKRLLTLPFALILSILFLGSSVTFCDTGGTYNKAYDQSHEFSRRWSNSKAQLTPYWTPDGSHIVFGHAGRIYVVDANGSSLRSLSGSFELAHVYSPTAELDFSPSLSPDGSKVVYTTLRYATGELREHTYELAIQAIDGSDPLRLTTNDWDDVSPAWSPDGSRIAFVSDRGEGYRAYTIALDGSDERSVAPSVIAQSNAPVWSPDGSRLAFVGREIEIIDIPWLDTYYTRSTPTSELAEDGAVYREAIYTVNADGSDLMKLTWSNAPNAEPRTRVGISDLSLPEEEITLFKWSPDGQHLAFVAKYYGESDILYVISSDGSGLRQIFDLSPNTDSEFAKAKEFYASYRPTTFPSEPRFATYPPSPRLLDIAWFSDSSTINVEAQYYKFDFNIDDRDWHRAAGVYAVSADGSTVRLVVNRESEGYLEWQDRLVGTGPRRIVSHMDSTGPNVAPDVEGWILSTMPWQGSDQTLLVRTATNRLVAANPRQAFAADVAEHCASDTVVPNAGSNPGLVEDCRTLLEMRDTLAGEEVLYWTSDSPIVDWPGVGVSGSPPRVRSLTSVPGVQLNGTIPPAISKLTELRVLNLEDNELKGRLPSELGTLSNLEILDFGDWWAGHNELSGNIPPELGDLANLRVLDLSGNQFSGDIPSELSKLAKLEELYLSSNPMEGPIPPELGKLGNLRKLFLGGNQSELSGSIPPELGDLENLEVLSINWTQLTGHLPPELGKLSKLSELHIRGIGRIKGGISGPIPKEFANLVSLSRLNLEHNRLEGPIPPEMGDLVEEVGDGYRMRLSYVTLIGNLLTGCVPVKWQYIWSLRVDLPFCE